LILETVGENLYSIRFCHQKKFYFMHIS